MSEGRKHILSSTYEFVVLEVADDLLCEGLGTLLELVNLFRAGLLELSLDRLHVALEVGEVRLLVKRSRLEAKRVDDIVDGGSTILESLVLVLSGGVGT